MATSKQAATSSKYCQRSKWYLILSSRSDTQLSQLNSELENLQWRFFIGGFQRSDSIKVIVCSDSIGIHKPNRLGLPSYKRRLIFLIKKRRVAAFKSIRFPALSLWNLKTSFEVFNFSKTSPHKLPLNFIFLEHRLIRVLKDFLISRLFIKESLSTRLSGVRPNFSLQQKKFRIRVYQTWESFAILLHRPFGASNFWAMKLIKERSLRNVRYNVLTHCTMYTLCSQAFQAALPWLGVWTKRSLCASHADQKRFGVPRPAGFFGKASLLKAL